MCDTCGCNVTHGNQHLIAPGGKLHRTERGGEALNVLKNLLSENDHMAAHNREHIDRHSVFTV
ncbi:MAG: hydrogenase nickel incorporation protein HypB, partial [Thiogranum sp.]